MLTYNHQDYIEKAILSVINQQTNFKYKLLIIDDASTDKTSTICSELKNIYADKIHLILNSANKGVRENAKTIHRLCFESPAKYIAILEGDDYWADVYKLQKQVDFLDTNQKFNICFHRVFELNENGEMQVSKLNSSEIEKDYTIQDLSKGNFIHTPSVLYRNILKDKLPKWFFDSPAGDYPLHMLNSRTGMIHYMPEVMAVYRVHNTSYWSSLNKIKKLKNWLQVINLLLSENFDDECINNLKIQKRNTQSELLEKLFDENRDEFWNSLKDFSELDPVLSNYWLNNKMKFIINNYELSKAYRLTKWIKSFKK